MAFEASSSDQDGREREGKSSVGPSDVRFPLMGANSKTEVQCHLQDVTEISSLYNFSPAPIFH